VNWNLFLHYFLRAMFDIKLKLACLAIVFIALLAAYLIFETPSYKTSWIVLLPGTERASTINLDNLGEARTNGANAYGSVSISPKNTYKEIALSDAVISVAAKQYGVPANAFSKPRITLIDQTPAMKFALKGESQEELSYRAKLYNDTFHRTLDKLRNNEIERTFEGVENKLEEAEKRLSNARQAIVDYQTVSSIVSEEQFRRWMADAEQLRTDNTDIEVKLAQLEATVAMSLKQLGVSEKQAQALLTLQANPAISATLDELSEKLAEQATIRLLYASAHPARQKNDREVSSLSKSIRSLLKNLPGIKQIRDNQLYGLLARSNTETIQKLNLQLADHHGLEAQKVALNNSYQRYLERIKRHTKDAAMLADLQRDHQIAEAIFSSALAKLDTSRLDIYATYPLTQLLTQPGATVKRDRLQAKLVILATIMIYMLLALALILNRVKHAVSKSDEAEQGAELESLLPLNLKLAQELNGAEA